MIIRIATTIADAWKANWEPVMIVRTIVEDLNMILLNIGPTVQIISNFRAKRYRRLPVPRGITIELIGRMSLSDLRQIQTYSMKG